jgi:hypothetical protein
MQRRVFCISTEIRFCLCDMEIDYLPLLFFQITMKGIANMKADAKKGIANMKADANNSLPVKMIEVVWLTPRAPSTVEK